jgi:cell wall-associated NlpC family hydrolase
MKRTFLLRTRRAAFCATLLFAGMTGSAWTTETPAIEPQSPLAPLTPMTPSGPLAKLHGLTSRASELAMHAMSMIGIRYKYGGNAPESGLDCSGLVRYVFRKTSGTELPRTSEEISRVGEKVESANLQPGDLVFYNTLRRGFSHVGIYLGDNKFIHAPRAGAEVRIESMDIGYWKKRFNGARRSMQSGQSAQPSQSE